MQLAIITECQWDHLTINLEMQVSSNKIFVPVPLRTGSTFAVLKKWIHMCWSLTYSCSSFKVKGYSSGIQQNWTFSYCRLLLEDLSWAILSSTQDKCHHPSSVGELYNKMNRPCVSNCQLLWQTHYRLKNLKIILLLMSKQSISASVSL